VSYVIRTKQSEFYLAKPAKIGGTVSWISLEEWMDWNAEPWKFETRAGADRARLMHSTRAETVYLRPPLVHQGTRTGRWSGGSRYGGLLRENLIQSEMARIMQTDFAGIEARIVAGLQDGSISL